MKIEVVRKVFARNDRAAEQNRARFNAHDVWCVNLLGGAGCGKTALLEAILPELNSDLRVGVLEGDLTTTRDAERIAALNVPVVQLLTEGGCHLTAAHVQRAIDGFGLDDLDLLFIENVGNPICPANFDLGEHVRIAVLSIAEGDDKPSKYPLLFRRAGLIALTKCDLTSLVDFDTAAATRDLLRINPRATIIETSVRSRLGIHEMICWLEQECRASRVSLDDRGDEDSRESSHAESIAELLC